MQGNSAELNAPLVAVQPDSSPRDVLHLYSSCSQCGRSVCQPKCQPHCCSVVKGINATYFLGATVSQMGCGPAVPQESALVCHGGRIYGVQNGTALLFWLYHMGDGAYRVLPLNTALALAQSSDGAVTQ